MNLCNRWGKKHIEHLIAARAVRKQNQLNSHTDRRRDLGNWYRPEETPHKPLPKAPEAPLPIIEVPEATCIAHAELLDKLKDHPQHKQFAILLSSLSKGKPKQLPYVPPNKLIGRTISTSINKIMYASGRLRWMQYYGREPLFVIDHINRDKRDNRIENLRDVPYVLLRTPYTTPYESLDETTLFLHQTYYEDLPPEKWGVLYGT